MSYSTLSLHGPYLTITRQPHDKDETPCFSVVDVRKIQDISNSTSGVWSIDCGETSASCDILLSFEELTQAVGMNGEDSKSEAWFRERLHSSFNVLRDLIQKGLDAVV